MVDLIKLLLEPLVKDVKKVKITQEKSETNSVNFTLNVPKDDIAKVIGKEGKMIKAIKNLLRVRASKEQVYASIDVQEA